MKLKKFFESYPDFLSIYYWRTIMQKQTRGLEHRIITTIGENYLYALKRISDLKRERNLSNSQKEIFDIYQKYVKWVEKALSQLDNLELYLMKNEYLTPFNKGWWIAYYPRSTFYRLRLRMSKKFIACYRGGYAIGL